MKKLTLKTVLLALLSLTHSVSKADLLVPFFRLFNGVDHFYTADSHEAMIANLHLGFGREGVAFRIHTGQAPQAPGTVPLYRLYKNNDHFYTISAQERDNAVAYYGYQFEGTAGFVFDSPKIPGLVPLHRLINRNNGEHFYTTSIQEANNAAAAGYVLEGAAAWVIP